MGRAESTTWLHLHTPCAIQGELFPTADAQPVTRGYRGAIASKVAGITYRQLDYWARKQIVDPLHRRMAQDRADCIPSKMWSSSPYRRSCWMLASICRM